MSFIKGIDVSHWQGSINWPAVRASGVEIALIKISGADAGLYYDSKATVNYYGAKNAGIAIGGYHFAGGGDARAEAEYFVAGMRPFEENDVFVLDWEIKHADPVGWCAAFLNRVHELTGVWPLLYMNGSTFNAYSWNANSTIANCGKWIAWYGRDPEQTLPVNGVYVMHQYTSSGNVPGITTLVDLDAWYGSVDQFRKYGYHAPVTAPTPPPAPVITTKTETTTKEVPFQKLTVDSNEHEVGYSEVTQSGVNGVETIVTTVTYTDGKETSRAVTSDTVTKQPVNEITTNGVKPVQAPQEPSEPSSPDNGDTDDSDQKNDLSLFKRLLTAFWLALVKFWKS